ncbi:hypothetical protein FE391_29585 [Nonomuraea sp. KC401]|uniref:hypothetical protein n=1 Tax=unclassified Nonomuraea TaxID=2593643 RepID=UPI0010FF4AA3|nr:MULTISPECIES: hypothetical protein [unclassified Nonomuraea]NBE97471.1 hypothetical protein [Nonomuraea sp. K271]TLF62724.1 hypothetical protein FE391_29585 [Nonomuraea sp. KC401]
MQELLQTTEGDLRWVAARAALLLDVAGRQLSTLRNTYPAWDIERHRDDAGRVWWTATLRAPFTVEMMAAGVWATVRQTDAMALAATLAWQSSLLHTARGRTRVP